MLKLRKQRILVSGLLMVFLLDHNYYAMAQNTIVQPPFSKIVIKDTADVIRLKRAQEIQRQVKMRVVVTAYTKDVESTGKSPGVETYGVTHTGSNYRRGIASVDPKVIPLNSKIWVPGYGWATAEDTGGDIQGARIDISIPDYNEAMAWGRQELDVLIELPEAS